MLRFGHARGQHEAGLEHQRQPTGEVQRLELELPVAVEDAPRHARAVERGHAGPAHALGPAQLLQALFEFQTQVALLTGMDVANASMYDGATSAAEAALMAVRGNRKVKSRQVLLAQLTSLFAYALLVESSLSYLGGELGVQEPAASWGNMLTDARSYFNIGTHLVIWPGVLIMVTVLSFYLVGDGLRDALDPRLIE